MSYESRLFKAIKNGQTAPKSNYDLWKDLGNEGDAQAYLDSLKGAGTITFKGITVPTSIWVSTEGIYKATIANEDITENDVVNMNFTTESLSTAIQAGILGYTNTVAGGFEIFSNFLPSSDLVIDYAVIVNV